MVKGFLYTLISCLLISQAYANDGHEGRSVGKTLQTLNTVSAVQNTVSRSIVRGDNISVLDIITTGDKARASFRFEDGTILTLGANSLLHVQDYQFSKTNKSASFEFIKGAFRVVTGAITKTKNPNFKVNTPIGSIGIRGTDFWGGNLSSENDIDVILLSSEHPLILTNAYGTITITQPGYGTTLSQNKAPSKAKKWPKEKLDRAVKTISFPK